MRDNSLETILTSPAAVPGHAPEPDRVGPESTAASENRNTGGAPQSRWRRPLLILGPIALVVGALVFYFATGRYVTEEDANVQAVNVSISPQVAGQVIGIAANSNTAANKGDPLFNLDPEPYRIALANAEAQLAVARDQVHTLIETYRSRLKQIDQAKATADYGQTTDHRQQQLYDTGAAPRATLDGTIRDLQTAKANLASLEWEATAALAQPGGNPDMPVDQQATVKQAQAAVDSAARNLQLTSIVAPVSKASRLEHFVMPVYLPIGNEARSLHRGQHQGDRSHLRERRRSGANYHTLQLDDGIEYLVQDGCQIRGRGRPRAQHIRLRCGLRSARMRAPISPLPSEAEASR